MIRMTKARMPYTIWAAPTAIAVACWLLPERLPSPSSQESKHRENEENEE
jgi:hypothetical protein